MTDRAEVFFHPEADTEYEEAFAWYAERSPEIAVRFEQEVEAAVTSIVNASTRWPLYDEVHRKVLLPRFPYLVIYREHESRVAIVAIAHGHRHPGYWKGRTIP